MTKMHQYLLADIERLKKEFYEIGHRFKEVKRKAELWPGINLEDSGENFETISLPNAMDKAYDAYHRALKLLDDCEIAIYPYVGRGNPVTSFKIDEPRKTAKKEKWWIVKLVDETGFVLKEVIVPFRTKTEIKLYVKSTIGKLYQSRAINSAVVEGPYKTMMEASKHKSVP